MMNHVERDQEEERYENPKEDHDYILTVDVLQRSRKRLLELFCVFDTTTLPYKMVAKYRNNQIKPLLFPNVILEFAKAYNNSYILCEVNDIGDQVAYSTI